MPRYARALPLLAAALLVTGCQTPLSRADAIERAVEADKARKREAARREQMKPGDSEMLDFFQARAPERTWWPAVVAR